MTTREAFEEWSTAWIEKDCPSLKADLLERKGETYANAMQRVQWKTWQAATDAALERAALECYRWNNAHNAAEAIRALKDEK